MNDDRITDLRRELRKARESLAACELHLARHAEMNAALHCSPTVMYSPLHARVTAAITQIEHALLRTDTGPDTARTAPDTATSDTDTPPVDSTLTSADTVRTQPDTEPCAHLTEAVETLLTEYEQETGRPAATADEVRAALRTVVEIAQRERDRRLSAATTAYRAGRVSGRRGR